MTEREPYYYLRGERRKMVEMGLGWIPPYLCQRSPTVDRAVDAIERGVAMAIQGYRKKSRDRVLLYHGEKRTSRLFRTLDGLRGHLHLRGVTSALVMKAIRAEATLGGEGIVLVVAWGAGSAIEDLDVVVVKPHVHYTISEAYEELERVAASILKRHPSLIPGASTSCDGVIPGGTPSSPKSRAVDLEDGVPDVYSPNPEEAKALDHWGWISDFVKRRPCRGCGATPTSRLQPWYRCGACEVTTYCSVRCKNLHWNRHKDYCLLTKAPPPHLDERRR